jgi:hypothetical protein
MKVVGGRRWFAVAGAFAVAAGVVAGGLGISGMRSADAATTQASTVSVVRLDRAQLLTVKDVRKADPKEGWVTQVDRGRLPRTYCGPASTEGKRVSQRMARGFTDEMTGYGAQYVSRYPNAATAKAAYASIIKVLKTCPAGKPAPTHTRKITENRVVKGASGDLTQVIRWYDYPLPSDPGSEAGGFPYAVTLKGQTVSVLAFSDMGPGMSAPNFDKLARAAAVKLPR